MCVYTHLHAILTACNARHLARACQHPGQLPEPPRAYCSRLYSHCFSTSARYCVQSLFGMSLPAAIHITEDPTCLWSQSMPWVKSSQGSHQKVPAIPARHCISRSLPLACFPVFKSRCPTCRTSEHPCFSASAIPSPNHCCSALGLAGPSYSLGN